MAEIFRIHRTFTGLWKRESRRTQLYNSRPYLEVLEDRLTPAVFNVNSLADVLNPPRGVVTLRSAIAVADAGPGDNTINLTLPGTYKSSLGSFVISPTSNLTIQNTSGGAVVVDGNHLGSVFDINPGTVASGFQVTLQGFTIQNGATFGSPYSGSGSGGGIRDEGDINIVLNNMTITHNAATYDGGGICMYNPSGSTFWTLTVNNSTISNNYAGGAGGGIETDGKGTVLINAGSIITSNTALTEGGGIALDSITEAVDSVTLQTHGFALTSPPSVTFTPPPGSATATATSLLLGGSVYVATITSTGSGYTAPPTITFSRPRFGGTTATGVATISGGAVTSITITNGGSGYLFAPTVTISPPQDTATGYTTIDNTGSVTSVVLTNSGSGYTAAPTVSFSLPSPGGTNPTATTNVVAEQSANLTLTDALINANNCIGGTASFGGGIANTSNGTVTINNSTIENNLSAGSGGGIGGGIGGRVGYLAVSGSFFYRNSAAGNGGAIDTGTFQTSITNTTIDSDTSLLLGGGIFGNGYTLSVQNSTISNNTSAGGGGGVDVETTGTGSPGSDLTNDTIVGNKTLSPSVFSDGGGILLGSGLTGSIIILNDSINSNYASSKGGGIYFWGGPGSTVSVQNTIIAQNTTGTVFGLDISGIAAGTFNDLGGNLIGIGDVAAPGFIALTTRIGTFANPIDPLLGALQNNGGPTTGVPGHSIVLQTESLLSGSPAIAAGVPSGAPSTDGRGYQIPPGAAIDVGAFQTKAFPVTTPNQRYVASIFQTLLGRSPGPGAAIWVTMLNQGVSPATIVLDIEGSSEYRGDMVKSYYLHYLHRPADSGGLQAFINAIASGATFEQVQASIVGSLEYFQIHGSTNAGFVTGLFQDVLNRSPDNGGLNSFTGELNRGMPRSQVAAQILGSAEYFSDLVSSDYQTLLGRSADSVGTAAFLLAFQSGARDEQITAAILGSPEAFARRT